MDHRFILIWQDVVDEAVLVTESDVVVMYSASLVMNLIS